MTDLGFDGPDEGIGIPVEWLEEFYVASAKALAKIPVSCDLSLV